jgi:nicotinamide-nucleotide amidase
MKRAEQVLVNLLKERKFNIAFAESMTCGLIAHKLGTVSGTSEVLAGSIVCYSEHVKTETLGVSKKLIKIYTAESQQVADALVKNLKKTITANIYASIVGLASEGGSETKSKPVGTVFFSVLIGKKLFRMKKKFNGSPMQIKERACENLFRFISKNVKIYHGDMENTKIHRD